MISKQVSFKVLFEVFVTLFCVGGHKVECSMATVAETIERSRNTIIIVIAVINFIIIVITLCVPTVQYITSCSLNIK